MSGNILIVEDEPEIMQALRVRLTAGGFRCETASNGKEALQKVEAQRPDLIIADLVMPVMDGYEMVERLKGDARTAAIPVVVLTALPDRSPRTAKELKAERVMRKPFDSAALLRAVQELLPGSETASGGTGHG